MCESSHAFYGGHPASIPLYKVYVHSWHGTAKLKLTSPYDTVSTVLIQIGIDDCHFYLPSNTAYTVSCILYIHL